MLDSNSLACKSRLERKLCEHDQITKLCWASVSLFRMSKFVQAYLIRLRGFNGINAQESSVQCLGDSKHSVCMWAGHVTINFVIPGNAGQYCITQGMYVAIQSEAWAVWTHWKMNSPWPKSHLVYLSLEFPKCRYSAVSSSTPLYGSLSFGDLYMIPWNHWLTLIPFAPSMP